MLGYITSCMFFMVVSNLIVMKKNYKNRKTALNST